MAEDKSIAFSSHPGHGSGKQTAAEHSSTKSGSTGKRHTTGEAGKLKYKPTATD